MKKHIKKGRLYFTLIAVFSFVYLHAENPDSNNQAIDKNKSHPTVINTKMIERFNTMYNEIEVVPWFEIMATKTFEETKNYITAYNTLNMDTIHSKEVYDKLTQLKEKIETDTKNETVEFKNHASLNW